MLAEEAGHPIPWAGRSGLMTATNDARASRNDRPAISDSAKALGILAMRRSHHRTLERTSKRTYRRRIVPTSPAPRLNAAARVHKGMGWLPTSLIVPEALPKEAKLPKRYFLPYYATSKIGWTLYGRSPIDPDLDFSPSSIWNRWFPDASRGWGSPSDDASFAALRLQGPNPFMLRQVEPDPARREAIDDPTFSLDFGPLFAEAFPATEARFGIDSAGSLVPTSIRIGGDDITRGEPRWGNAKRVVNGLDARYAVFIRHLLNVHLMVGQAYAIAAYTLPIWHPLRPFMQFFTYGTLVVNDAAYKALLTDDSYFVRSNFVTKADARLLVLNAMDTFDFDEWCWPNDRAARGLANIPNHPYVEDADLIWPALEHIVERHLNELGLDDSAVQNDPQLRRWYDTFTDVLPASKTIPLLRSRDDLATLMTGVLWNNVIHEVCGNLSPLLDTRDHDDLVAVNFEDLRALADPDAATPRASAADVYLMDQATYVSRFNVGGNNLTKIEPAAYIDDPRLRESVRELQNELERINLVIKARNAARDIPLESMEPDRFEASISF